MTKAYQFFVRNRVCEIKGHSDIVMSYVNTKENPADVGTKGTTPKALYSHDLWWHGPVGSVDLQVNGRQMM